MYGTSYAVSCMGVCDYRPARQSTARLQSGHGISGGDEVTDMHSEESKVVIRLTRESLQNDRARLQNIWSQKGYYENRTISDALSVGTHEFPDIESIYYSEDQEQRFTNQQLNRDGLVIASALSKLGIVKGDVVAIQLPTWFETAIIYRAVAHIGAIALPIVTIYGMNEIKFILEQSGAKAFFMPGQWRKTDFTERRRELASLPDLETVIFVRGECGGSALSWDKLKESGEVNFVPASCSPDDVALLMYTSGTTSAPKGVQHTHNTLLREWSRPSYENRGLYLSNLPAGHYTGYSYIMRPMIYGAPMVFIDQWDAYRAAKLIEQHRVRHGGGTPVFLLTLLDAAKQLGADISSLQSFSLGGQGMVASLIEKADQAGFPGCRVYGLTEHPTVTALDTEAAFEKRAGTDGRLDEGNEIRVIDEVGNDVALGQEGELLTRGPEMFVGYLDSNLDLDSFLPGFWFRTGDIGRMDADGYLTITDRKKDIIIRGGENISSVEIEEILLQYPAIKEAAAVAMPDPIYGERVCAFIALNDGASITIDDLRIHFQARGVARQKTPERLEIMEELPRNPSGKIKKFELRRIAHSFSDDGTRL